MARAMLKSQASIKEACRYVSLMKKTEALIERLADKDFSWTDKDVKRAIRETGVYDFSLEDIEYVRELRKESKHRRLKARIELLLESLQHIEEGDERRRFFDEEIRPLARKKRSIEREIKKKYIELEYYREDQESDQEMVDENCGRERQEGTGDKGD